jgi:hypothetical protein
LRQFAGLWLVFFAGLACWQGLGNGRPTLGLSFAGLALAVGPLGLVKPRAIRWLFVGWMVLAFPIGWTISRLLLACLYYGVFTPVALLFRAIGRDVLCRRRRSGAATYWAPKPQAANVHSYFRQF